jgi:hypothetical protein
VASANYVRQPDVAQAAQQYVSHRGKPQPPAGAGWLACMVAVEVRSANRSSCHSLIQFFMFAAGAVDLLVEMPRTSLIPSFQTTSKSPPKDRHFDTVSAKRAISGDNL